MFEFLKKIINIWKQTECKRYFYNLGIIFDNNTGCSKNDDPFK